MTSVTTATKPAQQLSPYIASIGPTLAVHLPGAPAAVELVQAYLQTVSFEPFVDLSKPATLKGLVAERFRKGDHLTSAKALVGRVYEAHPRRVVSDTVAQSGLAFPMYPEVTATFMRALKEGGAVLEIGAAGGENSILLAYAGAMVQVYVNEFAGGEVEKIQALKAAQPKDVAARVTVIAGDCLDILKKCPQLEGQLTLILLRNVVHFFNDERQTKLFALARRLLKRDGALCLSTNSVYGNQRERAIFEANPTWTSFVISQCQAYDKAGAPIYTLGQHFMPLSHTLNSLENFRSEPVYEQQTNTTHSSVIEKMPDSLKAQVKVELPKLISKLGPFPGSRVHYQQTPIRLYSYETVGPWLNSHQFDVETLFAVGLEGHLVHTAPFAGELIQAIGAIARVRRPAAGGAATTSAAATK
jgi:SAM-dependent methyltransferase